MELGKGSAKDLRKKPFFSNQVMGLWNKLSEEIMYVAISTPFTQAEDPAHTGASPDTQVKTNMVRKASRIEATLYCIKFHV